MRVLKHSDVDHSLPWTEFRNQSWLALFWLAVLMASIAIFVFLPKPGGGGIGWAMLPALLGLFFSALAVERFRLCRKPAAWLLRAGPDGILVNLRSYQNYHLPAETHQVVFIPREEIVAIARIRETRKVPDRRRPHTDRYTFIDIYLNHGDLGELRSALREERRLEAPAGRLQRAKRHDYPVRLQDPPGIRLVWDWMRPGENHALDLLGRHFPIAPNQEVLAKSWEKMGPEEREQLMLEFWEWGYLEDAVRMGKMQWNIGDFRAKKRLEELARENET